MCHDGLGFRQPKVKDVQDNRVASQLEADSTGELRLHCNNRNEQPARITPCRFRPTLPQTAAWLALHSGEVPACSRTASTIGNSLSRRTPTKFRFDRRACNTNKPTRITKLRLPSAATLVITLTDFVMQAPRDKECTLISNPSLHAPSNLLRRKICHCQ